MGCMFIPIARSSVIPFLIGRDLFSLVQSGYLSFLYSCEGFLSRGQIVHLLTVGSFRSRCSGERGGQGTNSDEGSRNLGSIQRLEKKGRSSVMGNSRDNGLERIWWGPSTVGGFPGGSVVKNLPANARDAGLIPWSGRPPGEGNGNSLQYSCLGNPWTEEPGGLQSLGSQRVRHKLTTKQQQQSTVEVKGALER